MLPMIAGFLIAGPVSGWLSDRYGARPFATGGMLLAALSFGLLELLPVDFPYALFALFLLLNGIGMGLFSSQLISGPFSDALNVAFTFALVACLVAAVASALRGGRYHHDDESPGEAALEGEAIDRSPAGITAALIPEQPSAPRAPA